MEVKDQFLKVVGKLLMALVTKVNTGLVLLNFDLGLIQRVHIYFSVTVHSLKIRGRGGLSEMTQLQPIPQMIGYRGAIFKFQ